MAKVAAGLYCCELRLRTCTVMYISAVPLSFWQWPAPPATIGAQLWRDAGILTAWRRRHLQKEKLLNLCRMQPFRLRTLHFNLTRSSNCSPSPITRSFKVARQQPLVRAAHRVCLFCWFIQMWPARRSRGRSEYISIGGRRIVLCLSSRDFHKYKGQGHLFADCRNTKAHRRVRKYACVLTSRLQSLPAVECF